MGQTENMDSYRKSICIVLCCFAILERLQTYRMRTLVKPDHCSEFLLLLRPVGLRSGNVSANKYIKINIIPVVPQAFWQSLFVYWLMIKISISNSYFPFLLLHDTRCDMNHKSWVTSRQFPRQNLAEQTVSTTLYCISVLGQNNPIEQLSEGRAKQFIELDVILGIKQGLRPSSGLFLCEFFTCTLPRLREQTSCCRYLWRHHCLDHHLRNSV